MKFPAKKEAVKGELFILSEALLWSFFPIISILTFSSLDPLYTAGLSTLTAAFFFAVVLTWRKRWHEVLRRDAWRDILYTTLIIGVLFYVLVFLGIQRTTAGNSSIIAQMEVFFSFVILGSLLKKEKMSFQHKLGAFLMVVGALLVLFQGSFQLNEGDAILLVAMILPPLGNYFAQRARKKVESYTIMFIRSLIAGIFILFLALIFAPIPGPIEIQNSFVFLLINGILLMGLSKFFWLEGIHRIFISKAISLNAVTPFFTLVFAYFILGEVPKIWQLLGLIPLVIGILILSEFRSKNWRGK